jgi:hypothetical protein
MTTNESHTSRDSISRGLIVAAFLIGAAYALKRLTPDPVSPALASRLVGVLMGAMVVFFANDVPKALSPLTRMRCDPATEQSIRRFTGWSLALGGLAYMLASLLAPLESAPVIAAGLLGASVLLVLVRLGRAMAGK